MGWLGIIWQDWTRNLALITLSVFMYLSGELIMCVCVCVFYFSSGISGFCGWGRLMRPDSPYDSLAAYLLAPIPNLQPFIIPILVNTTPKIVKFAPKYWLAG